jgi:hypothetical protein
MISTALSLELSLAMLQQKLSLARDDTLLKDTKRQLKEKDEFSRILLMN